MNEKLTKIETVLLKREVALVNAEVSRGAKIIVEAFAKYLPPEDKTQWRNTDISVGRQLHEYLQKICVFDTCQGEHITQNSLMGVSDRVSGLPSFIQQLILDHVVKNFMTELERAQVSVPTGDEGAPGA